MSIWLLGLLMLIHAGIAVSEARIGNWPMAFVFACYSMSNIGFIFLSGR